MLHALRARLRALFAPAETERELDEEMHSHIERDVERHVAAGMSPGEARLAAHRAFGNMPALQEQARDAFGTRFVLDVAADVRYAARVLRRSPAFTTVSLLTLALGLGANTAIFTVVNAVLFRPLDYRDPARLVTFDGTIAAGTFLDLRAQLKTLDRLGAAEFWTPTLTGRDAPEQILALHISADILPMLGVRPALGRVPRPEEEHAGRERVVVLSHGSWERRFAADSGALGRTLTLDGNTYTIVGVMPRSFQFAPYWATAAEMWAPLMLDARTADRDGSSLRLFARLTNGATTQVAQADLNAVSARLGTQYPGKGPTVHVVSLHEMVVGGVRTPLLILLGAVALVFLIACANVSHLQLMRAAARARESAVRVALGASRARLVRQSMVESTLLAITGAALALGVAWAGVHVLVGLAPPSVPRVTEIGLDGSVFAFLFVASLAASIIVGVGPALRASGVKTGDALKEGGRGASDGPRRRFMRGALVTSEFGMALVLLVAAALLIRSFVALERVDNGFDPRNALTMNVSLDGTSHREHAQRGPFFRELLARVSALPGVEAIAAINHLPIAGDNWHFPFTVEGRPLAGATGAPKALFRVVQPGYFAATRIPLLNGRDFSPDDQTNRAHVAIVNETMARRHWPGESAIGGRISVDDPAKRADWFTIVGVAKDATQARLSDATEEEMYFPFMLDPNRRDDTAALISFLDPSNMMLFIRAKGAPAALEKPVQAIVRSMDRDAAVAGVATMDAVMASQFTTPTFYLLLLGSFAGVAVVLAAVGVYGVISYAAAARTREMGVRIALGAVTLEPFRLIAAEGMRLAAIGGALGLVAAFALTRHLRALLFGVQPTDPSMFALATLVLAAVALVACYIPARRAGKVDPVIALRSE
jgi:putative ABC transport system permease protein